MQWGSQSLKSTSRRKLGHLWTKQLHPSGHQLWRKVLGHRWDIGTVEAHGIKGTHVDGRLLNGQRLECGKLWKTTTIIITIIIIILILIIIMATAPKVPRWTTPRRQHPRLSKRQSGCCFANGWPVPRCLGKLTFNPSGPKKKWGNVFSDIFGRLETTFGYVWNVLEDWKLVSPLFSWAFSDFRLQQRGWHSWDSECPSNHLHMQWWPRVQQNTKPGE